MQERRICSKGIKLHCHYPLCIRLILKHCTIFFSLKTLITYFASAYSSSVLVTARLKVEQHQLFVQCGRIPRALPYSTRSSSMSPIFVYLNSNPSLISFSDEQQTLGFSGIPSKRSVLTLYCGYLPAMKRASAKTVVLKLQQMYLADDSADDNDDDSFSARNISARQRSST